MNDVKRRLEAFLLSFLLVTTIGTVGFMWLEKVTFVDSLYFNIVTMATVGYGDIHPTTPAGRLFAVFLIIAGGTAFLGVIANATELVILRREFESRMKKINMVLGVFFSEVGYRLIGIFSAHDAGLETVREALSVSPGWPPERFAAARKGAASANLTVDTANMDLSELHAFLLGKRRLLVGLMENPALVEHEGFSEALLAVFHLLDELASRENLSVLPPSDRKHLAGDMNRAYRFIVEQWLVYLEHLKKQYPYLYSLAVRKNPFDPKANPLVLD